MSYSTPSAYDAILAREGTARHKRAAAVLLMVVLIVVAMALTGLILAASPMHGRRSNSFHAKCFRPISGGTRAG